MLAQPVPSVCLSVSCSPLLAATGQGREEQASTEGEGETDDRDRVQAGAGGKVLSMEKGRGGPGGGQRREGRQVLRTHLQKPEAAGGLRF